MSMFNKILILIGVLLMYFLPNSTTQNTSPSLKTSTETITTATSTVEAQEIPTKKPSVATTFLKAKPIATTTTHSETEITQKNLSASDFEKINEFTRQSIVNIICRNTKNEEISGSGVLVDPRGIILTNAHLG